MLLHVTTAVPASYTYANHQDSSCCSQHQAQDKTRITLSISYNKDNDTPWTTTRLRTKLRPALGLTSKTATDLRQHDHQSVAD